MIEYSTNHFEVDKINWLGKGNITQYRVLHLDGFYSNGAVKRKVVARYPTLDMAKAYANKQEKEIYNG